MAAELYKIYAILQSLEKIPETEVLVKAKAVAMKTFLQTYVKALDEGRSYIESQYKNENEKIPPTQKKKYSQDISNYFEIELDLPLKPFTRQELKRCELDPQTIKNLIPLIK